MNLVLMVTQTLTALTTGQMHIVLLLIKLNLDLIQGYMYGALSKDPVYYTVVTVNQSSLQVINLCQGTLSVCAIKPTYTN